MLSLKLTLLNGSVVVLAETHNPSILHPSFLSGQGIVSDDWKLSESPVCTPAISVVKYENQVVFVAEPNKFQVLDNAPTAETKIPGIAIKYIEALPHVRYTAVGVNFAAFVQCDAPERFLIKRFLTPGPWNSEKTVLSSLGLNFVYPVDRGTARLSCEPGSVRRKGETKDKPGQECVLVNANYNLEITKNPLEECKIAINLFEARLAHLNEIARIIFELEA